MYWFTKRSFKRPRCSLYLVKCSSTSRSVEFRLYSLRMMLPCAFTSEGLLGKNRINLEVLSQCRPCPI